MIEADVIIIGAGPAGSTAALNLAPTRRVVLIERRPDIPPRIGESLVPAARRLFTDMGLWPSFEAEPHAHCHGNRSVWGSNEPVDSDLLRDPDGHGWHLDRSRFHAWLRVIAVARGAQRHRSQTSNGRENAGPCRWRRRRDRLAQRRVF